MKRQNDQDRIETIPTRLRSVEGYSAYHRLSDNSTYKSDQISNTRYSTYNRYPNFYQVHQNDYATNGYSTSFTE